MMNSTRYSISRKKLGDMWGQWGHPHGDWVSGVPTTLVTSGDSGDTHLFFDAGHRASAATY